MQETPEDVSEISCQATFLFLARLKSSLASALGAPASTEVQAKAFSKGVAYNQFASYERALFSKHG